MKQYFSNGRSNSNDFAFLKKAGGIVISHLEDEHFSGNELSEKLNLSREQTHRKIKQFTSVSTGKFIRYIRLLKACVYLLEGNLSVAEIGFKVGFEDPSYFNKCFREETGISPGEIKKTGDIMSLTKTPLFSFYQIPAIKDQLQRHGIVFEFPQNKNENEASYEEEKGKRKGIKVWLMAGVLTIALLFSFFFNPRKSNKYSKVDFGENYRIAVLPFTNQTGDSSLDQVGDIASSWLSHQLAELKKVQTVPYFTVKQYQPYIGILSDDPQGRPTFRDLVSARYFISGDYYLKESQVYFNSRFVDASTLEPVYDFPVMHGNKDSIMVVIEQLRMKIAGLIANLEEVKLGKQNPPNYEAYAAYLRGLHEMGVGLYTQESLLYLEKAAALEPDFVMPRIFLTWFYRGQKRDSVFQQISRITSITGYEKSVYNFMYHLCNHNYNESLRIILQGLDEYPQDYYFNIFAGHHAKSMFRYNLALKVLNRLQDPINSDVGMVWHYYKVWNYAESLIMLGKYQDVVNYLSSVPIENYNTAIPKLFINVLVKLGKKKEEVGVFIEKTGGEKMKYLTGKFDLEEKKLYAEFYTTAAYEYYLAGDSDASRHFAEKAIALFTTFPGKDAYHYDIADAYYLSGDVQKTKNYLEKELKKNPGNDDLLIYLAQAEAALGNEAAALKIFSTYDARPLIQWRRHEFEYQRDYLKARIYALLGKRDQALILLRNALEKGQLCHYWDFGRDIFLKSLIHETQFREMIRAVDVE